MYLLVLAMNTLVVLLQASEAHSCQSGLRSVPGFAEREKLVYLNTIHVHMH